MWKEKKLIGKEKFMWKAREIVHPKSIPQPDYASRK